MPAAKKTPAKKSAPKPKTAPAKKQPVTAKPKAVGEKTGPWLVKQEPEGYPFSQLVKDGSTAWTGVRNFQARNFLAAMKKGDDVLYYHSGEEKAVVGIAAVAREAYADPTATEGDWKAVDIKAVRALAKAVPLSAIKEVDSLKETLLVRHTRLSVQSIPRAAYDRIVKMGGK